MIRAHVDNALMFVDTRAEDLSFDRAIDIDIGGRPAYRSSINSRRQFDPLQSLSGARVGIQSAGLDRGRHHRNRFAQASFDFLGVVHLAFILGRDDPGECTT